MLCNGHQYSPMDWQSKNVFITPYNRSGAIITSCTWNWNMNCKKNLQLLVSFDITLD